MILLLILLSLVLPSYTSNNLWIIAECRQSIQHSRGLLAKLLLEHSYLKVALPKKINDNNDYLQGINEINNVIALEGVEHFSPGIRNDLNLKHPDSDPLVNKFLLSQVILKNLQDIQKQYADLLPCIEREYKIKEDNKKRFEKACKKIKTWDEKYVESLLLKKLDFDKELSFLGMAAKNKNIIELNSEIDILIEKHQALQSLYEENFPMLFQETLKKRKNLCCLLACWVGLQKNWKKCIKKKDRLNWI